LINAPNSLVVAPSGATAYVGSSAGLVVVNLNTYVAATQAYPVLGGISTDVVTGQVLGVSPNSRYVVTSDGTHVFLIDTTGTKVATRYSIPNIDAVTFAADGSNMWIAANPPASDTTAYSGVYIFNSDTFVPTANNASTHVKALAWMPDGQSYFASGDQLVDYSTCTAPATSVSKPPTLPSLGGSATGPINLDSIAINGAAEDATELVGLSPTEWLDYSVTTSAAVGSQSATTPSGLTFGGTGNVCLSTVTVATPVATTASLPCAATQVTFSPRLEAEFVTGVDPGCTVTDSIIHGYDVSRHALTPSITAADASITPLSGGVLSDGRKLYVGTWTAPLAGTAGTAGTATLHRFDLSTGSATTPSPTVGLLDGLLTEDLSTSVELVPSFVAVVPK
jgi:hypothetical protein